VVLGTRCVLLGVGGVCDAAGAATTVVVFVAAGGAASRSGCEVDNGAVIVPVVVVVVVAVVIFAFTMGVRVNKSVANACASTYQKNVALCVGDLLVLVLRFVEHSYVLEGLAIPRDGFIVGVVAVPMDGFIGRTIAWKATDASLDDIVLAILVRVPVNLLKEQRRRGLDLR